MNKRPLKTVSSISNFGLALAGGGFMGAVYELGALTAVEEAIPGLKFNTAKSYVGVSAGAFIAAGLANGIPPREMVRLFVEDGHPDGFDPAAMLRPDLAEYGKRALTLPPLLASALWHYATHPTSALAAFRKLGRAMPTGVFTPTHAEAYLERLLTSAGRSNDFRKLASALRIVATDLDVGTAVEFGSPELAHVPISRAVLASAAFPGIFPPVEIDGRHYVDGALRKTLHASVALDAGVKLLFCFNPIVPLDTARSRAKSRKLIDSGLPGVLAQTLRSLIHSRMAVGMERYRSAYPDSDIVLFEPDHGDDELFFVNIFATSGRQRLCEHAYRSTRVQLWQRRHELAPVLARHGLNLDVDALMDPSRGLLALAPTAPPTNRGLSRATASLDAALSDTTSWLKTQRA